MVDKVAQPAFTLHVNGCDRLGQERFGDSWGVMLENRIPDFLVALGKKVSETGKSFMDWYPDHLEEMHTLAEEYMA